MISIRSVALFSVIAFSAMQTHAGKYTFDYAGSPSPRLAYVFSACTSLDRYNIEVYSNHGSRHVIDSLKVKFNDFDTTAAYSALAAKDNIYLSTARLKTTANQLIAFDMNTVYLILAL
jgi:hypothetical protein